MEKNYHWILHIETSTKACSVCLSLNGELKAVRELISDSFSHAEKLSLFIEEVILETAISIKNLSAIAISKGPGSYTGLRIGTATAKGLAYSLKIPLIAIDTCVLPVYNAMLSSETKTTDYFLSVLKARQNEVFYGVYQDKKRVDAIGLKEIEENSFSDLKRKDLLVVGNAIDIFEEKNCNADTWQFISLKNPYSSVGMVTPAYQKFMDKDFVDTAYFEPFYLKDFIVAKKKVK